MKIKVTPLMQITQKLVAARVAFAELAEAVDDGVEKTKILKADALTKEVCEALINAEAEVTFPKPQRKKADEAK